MQTKASNLDYVIDFKDLDLYENQRMLSFQLARIWQDVLNHLPPNLHEEAESKGFTLIAHPDLKETRLDKTYLLQINNPSPELKQAMQSLYLDIICLKP